MVQRILYQIIEYSFKPYFLEMLSNRYIISFAFLLPYKWLPILWCYYDKQVSLVHLLNLQQHYANLHLSVHCLEVL